MMYQDIENDYYGLKITFLEKGQKKEAVFSGHILLTFLVQGILQEYENKAGLLNYNPNVTFPSLCSTPSNWIDYALLPKQGKFNIKNPRLILDVGGRKISLHVPSDRYVYDLGSLPLYASSTTLPCLNNDGDVFNTFFLTDDGEENFEILTNSEKKGASPLESIDPKTKKIKERYSYPDFYEYLTNHYGDDLNSAFIAEEILNLLSGERLPRKEAKILPLLVATFFGAEVSRNRACLITGLMLMDLMIARIDAPGNNGKKNFYCFKNSLFHPNQYETKASKAKGNDAAIRERKLGGFHPMAHLGSYSDEFTAGTYQCDLPLKTSHIKSVVIMIDWFRHHPYFTKNNIQIEKLSTQDYHNFILQHGEKSREEQEIILTRFLKPLVRDRFNSCDPMLPFSEEYGEVSDLNYDKYLITANADFLTKLTDSPCSSQDNIQAAERKILFELNGKKMIFEENYNDFVRKFVRLKSAYAEIASLPESDQKLLKSCYSQEFISNRYHNVNYSSFLDLFNKIKLTTGVDAETLDVALLLESIGSDFSSLQNAHESAESYFQQALIIKNKIKENGNIPSFEEIITQIKLSKMHLSLNHENTLLNDIDNIYTGFNKIFVKMKKDKILPYLKTVLENSIACLDGLKENDAKKEVFVSHLKVTNNISDDKMSAADMAEILFDLNVLKQKLIKNKRASQYEKLHLNNIDELFSALNRERIFIDPSLLIDVLFDLGYCFLILLKRPDIGQKAFKEESEKELEEFLNTYAHSTAILCFETALRVAKKYNRKLKLENKILRILNNLSDSYYAFYEIFGNISYPVLDKKQIDLLEEFVEITDTITIDRLWLAKIFRDLGNLYARSQNFDKAVKYLNKALDIKKDYFPKNHIEMHQILFDLGMVNFKVAANFQEKTKARHKIERSMAILYFYHRKNSPRFQNAQAVLDSHSIAKVTDSQIAASLIQMGLQALLDNNLEEAINCFTESNRLAASSLAYAYLARCYLFKHDSIQVNYYFKMGNSLREKSPIFLVAYASFLFRQERFEEAVIVADECLAKKTTDVIKYTFWDFAFVFDNIKKLIQASPEKRVVLATHGIAHYIKLLAHFELKEEIKLRSTYQELLRWIELLPEPDLKLTWCNMIKNCPIRFKEDYLKSTSIFYPIRRVEPSLQPAVVEPDTNVKCLISRHNP